MGKRSDFPRRKADQYYSPAWVINPLLPFLEAGTEFVEPCAGAGDLVRALQRRGMRCIMAYDIDPGCLFIKQRDALVGDIEKCDCIITNSPWTRELLHPMIDRFMRHAPTWMLFDAGWMFSSYRGETQRLMRHCVRIVAVGRVKWFEDTKHVSMDDVAWYLFDINHTDGPKFHAKENR